VSPEDTFIRDAAASKIGAQSGQRFDTTFSKFTHNQRELINERTKERTSGGSGR
jgi:hypothetical protein